MTTITDRLHTALHAVQQHLEHGIIPFWLARARDERYGGYLTNFDEQGRALAMPEKYLNTQCRLLWTFAQLQRKYPHISGCAELARWGMDFLETHLWDAQYGGFYWKVQRDGSLVDDAKIVYGESFAMYALAEYALSGNDPRGREYAGKTFDLLQKYCTDTLHGGYYENILRDWSVEEPGFAGGDRKGLDTHMHLMESFTTLYEASGEQIHRQKLLELIELIATRMVDPLTGCGLNQFDTAFHPIPAIAIKRTWNAERVGEAPAQPTETTSYGHNLELVWLLQRALTIAHADFTPYLPLMRKLLDHAIAHGVDWEYGGIYRDGPRDGGALVLEKEFWQHSESLVGFLAGFELFGEPRYLDAFEALWDFVQKYMIIDGVGEWRTLLDRTGHPIDANIGNPWKVSYHTGRAMLECTERLQRLLARENKA